MLDICTVDTVESHGTLYIHNLTLPLQNDQVKTPKENSKMQCCLIANTKAQSVEWLKEAIRERERKRELLIFLYGGKNTWNAWNRSPLANLKLSTAPCLVSSTACARACISTWINIKYIDCGQWVSRPLKIDDLKHEDSMKWLIQVHVSTTGCKLESNFVLASLRPKF